MKFLTKAFIALVLASSLFAGTYNVDVAHSSVGFKIKHLMISNVRGDFKDFSGSFVYDEKNDKLVSLKGTIKATSIDTGIVKRDNHLRSDDFFYVAKYPEITFVLTKINADEAHGILTMHGVTKDVVLEYEKGGAVKDPWGNTRFGFSLEGKINRKDYGLKWNKLLEGGGITVGEIVKLYVEIEGILKK